MSRRFVHPTLGMPLTVRAALCVAVVCAIPCVGTAAQTETEARLLTRGEGVSLVRHALDYAAVGRKPDCSHLLHQVLTTAGLEYPYATSSEIFNGIPHFRRVRHAQPGDVIAWRGHVGIVVDADERTFYSSIRSGLRVDEYSNGYWRRRGTPRFYRYVVTPEVSSTLRASSQARAGDHERVLSDSAYENTNTSDASLSYEIPESVHIPTDDSKPSKADIEQAVSELSNATAPALQADRDISLWLVRDLKVKKVQTKGDSGWVEIQVRSAIQLEPDGVWKKVKVPKQRWELRRGEHGWTVFVPLGRVYVAQAAAIPVLDRQLSFGLEEPRSEEASNIRALLSLLRKE